MHRYEVLLQQEVLYVHSSAVIKVQYVAYVLFYELERRAGVEGVMWMPIR